MYVFSLIITTNLLLCVVYRAEDEITDGQTPMVTKHQAVQKCAETGSRLADYTDIPSNLLNTKILTELEDGQSAWIEGFAKFSPFLVWDGCFKRSENFQSLKRFDIGRPDLYTCSLECERVKLHVTYIGVQNTICFCINNEEKRFLNIYRDRNLFCISPCLNTGIDYCGSPLFVSIYRLIYINGVNWAHRAPALMQCVKVKLENQRFSFSTASCYSAKISGYLCKIGASSGLNKPNCHRIDDTGKFCLVYKRCTGKEAFSDCLYNNGTLIDLPGERRSLSLMSKGFWYWIGIYRTFEPTSIHNDNQTTCLAITKTDDNLFLDPDKCTSKKTYICQPTKSHTSASVSTALDVRISPFISASSKVSDPSPSIDSSTISTKRVSETDQEKPQIAYILVLVLLIMIMVIMLGFIVYNRQRTRQRGMHTRNDDAAMGKAAIKVEEQPTRSALLGSNIDTHAEHFIRYSKPEMTARQKLMRKSKSDSYSFNSKVETYSDSESTDKLKSREAKSGNQYDRIGCDERYTKSRETSDETNRYNVKCADNTYNTIKHITSICSVETTDASSSETEACKILTKDQLEPDTNGGQSLSSKKSDEENFYYKLTEDKYARSTQIEQDGSENQARCCSIVHVDAQKDTREEIKITETAIDESITR